MYTSTVTGSFVEKQSVVATSEEEANAKFLAGEGDVLERVETTDVHVTNVEEVEDEAEAPLAEDEREEPEQA